MLEWRGRARCEPLYKGPPGAGWYVDRWIWHRGQRVALVVKRSWSVAWEATVYQIATGSLGGRAHNNVSEMLDRFVCRRQRCVDRGKHVCNLKDETSVPARIIPALIALDLTLDLLASPVSRVNGIPRWCSKFAGDQARGAMGPAQLAPLQGERLLVHFCDSLF